jgi:hypothetical protein
MALEGQETSERLGEQLHRDVLGLDQRGRAVERRRAQLHFLDRVRGHRVPTRGRGQPVLPRGQVDVDVVRRAAGVVRPGSCAGWGRCPRWSRRRPRRATRRRSPGSCGSASSRCGRWRAWWFSWGAKRGHQTRPVRWRVLLVEFTTSARPCRPAAAPRTRPPCAASRAVALPKDTPQRFGRRRALSTWRRIRPVAVVAHRAVAGSRRPARSVAWVLSCSRPRMSQPTAFFGLADTLSPARTRRCHLST